MDLSVRNVERIWVDVPFRETPARNMIKELPHWTLFEICKVELACGVTGFGETMCYYTRHAVSDDTVKRVIGKSALEYLWDDTLGTGLQMALFDAVGKANETPCYTLMGKKFRDRAFIGWWDIDMPAEDWLEECQLAISKGYTNFKTKARPWYDLFAQCEYLSAELPPWFKVDLDFNQMLGNTANATRVLTEIQKCPQVAIFESPILQEDVAGNRYLKSMTNVPIAHHFGNPPIMTALKEDICDGFVINGGACENIAQGGICAMANKAFWLQLVGTGITAVWGLHQAAVLTHAVWPAINCHQLYVHQLIKQEIEVYNGTAAVPEAPGLGVELDEDAVERFRIQKKEKPYPAPGILLAIHWPSGAVSYYTHNNQYWDDFLYGRLPSFEKGVHLKRVFDDGSREWRKLYERARAGGVHSSEKLL